MNEAAVAPQIETPEIEKWAQIETPTHIIFYRAVYDSCPENPMDFDENNGRIVSFGRDHVGYENPENYLGDDGKWNLPENAVPLSYYEHSGSLWMIKDGAAPAGVEFQWDGVKMAGFWEPNELAMENINARIAEGKETLQAIKTEYCQAVLDEFNAYCNGDMYGYEVEKYALKRDEDGEVIDEQDYYQNNHVDIANDSCYGYIGYDNMKESLRVVVAAWLTD